MEDRYCFEDEKCELSEDLIRERAELWAVALEENFGREGRYVMYKDHFDLSGRRCCLAVARDVAKAHGLRLPANPPTNVPEEAVREWFGWDGSNPALLYKGDRLSALSLNDSDSLNHRIIAKAVRDTFLKPNEAL